MTAHVPEWMTEAKKGIEERYTEDAVNLAERFQEEFTALIASGKVKAGYAFTAAESIASKMPRVVYERLTDPNGREVTATIDVLMHTVYFEEE